MLRLADLRRAEAGDLQAITTLQHAAYARNRPLLGVEPLPLLADYAEILTTMEIWLAEHESRLLGCLILEPRQADLLIWSIATDPAALTKGVGLSMLVAADARARQLGLDLVRLYTGTPLRHLVAWYGRHGFVVERTEALPDRSLTHMVKQLRPTPLVSPFPVPPNVQAAPLYVDGRQSQAALDICRGALRALRALGFAGTTELTLATGRRADIIAVNAAGEIWIVEIKSSTLDFRADTKWPDYRAYCDRLLFAVAPDFPVDILPQDTGLLIADRFGGEVVRAATHEALPGARRKAMLIAIARTACWRMQTALDPESTQLDV